MKNQNLHQIFVEAILSHLLLFQRDDRAVTAAAPLPLEGSDLFCLYSQDLLLPLVL